LSPDGSQIFAVPPLLTFTMTDPDDDYTGTLVGYVDFLTSPLATGISGAATYNPTTGKWEYQTDIAAFSRTATGPTPGTRTAATARSIPAGDGIGT
jgi:hypothetical protein